MNRNQSVQCVSEARPLFSGEQRITVKQGRRMENLLLGSRQERAALLKAGLTGKDIESLYLRLNGITVVDV